jgi:hypothetical protein
MGSHVRWEGIRWPLVPRVESSICPVSTRLVSVDHGGGDRLGSEGISISDDERLVIDNRDEPSSKRNLQSNKARRLAASGAKLQILACK